MGAISAAKTAPVNASGLQEFEHRRLDRVDSVSRSNI
jgi:hypothetical protein